MNRGKDSASGSQKAIPPTRSRPETRRRVDKPAVLKAPELARVYVTLDRLVFHKLERWALEKVFAWVKQHLKEQEALGDLKRLCDANAEESELLWILAGCEGLPGLSSSQKLLGRSAEQFKKNVAAIGQAATIIESIQHHPFGLLARWADYSVGSLSESLRSYAALAQAAQRDFGHSAEWFLNITKARLVIHVTNRTKDAYDSEVSGLIAAMTDSTYNADAQRRWRHQHKKLTEDQWLDPYTVKTPVEREETRRLLQETARDPDVTQVISRSVSDMMEFLLLRSPQASLRNRRRAKKPA